MNVSAIDQGIPAAARLLKQADGLLLCAGAGMGVDSGLPDFRGDQGFWQAYPALGAARLSFQAIANPEAFDRMPRLAWGFYAHRLLRYRHTEPHSGFDCLRQIGETLPGGTFVFTSNVDGQFQKAGYDPSNILECHGSIHHLQCSRPCGHPIWSAQAFEPSVDELECTLTSDLPLCPGCGALARPNILMFNDARWRSDRSRQQQTAFEVWLERVMRPVVIELGAGTAIPTVRRLGESLAAALIRINLREPQVHRAQDVGLMLGAKEGAQALLAAMDSHL